jgi:hypothetical protein
LPLRGVSYFVGQELVELTLRGGSLSALSQPLHNNLLPFHYACKHTKHNRREQKRRRNHNRIHPRFVRGKCSSVSREDIFGEYTSRTLVQWYRRVGSGLSSCLAFNIRVDVGMRFQVIISGIVTILAEISHVWSVNAVGQSLIKRVLQNTNNSRGGGEEGFAKNSFQ